MIKFVCFFLLCLVVIFRKSGVVVTIGLLLELLLIFGCSFWLLQKHRAVAYLLNTFLCLLFSVQCLVMFFSGEFVSTLMIENANMLDNLGDKIGIYIIGAFGGILLSFFPLGVVNVKIGILKNGVCLLSFLYVFWGVGTHLAGYKFLSPLYSLFDTGIDVAKQYAFTSSLSEEEKTEILNYFHRDSLDTGFDKYGKICENPNVILFFTEGLSAEVLDVYNDLNLGLTPNLDSLHAVSLSFDNYFNHTAATFRGLRGQLYSTFQLCGGANDKGNGFAQISESAMLIKTKVAIKSLVDILRDNGYYSCFMNPEPANQSASNYIGTLGFDQVLPAGDYLRFSDKESFDFLGDIVLGAKTPFFIVFYNIGTHHGFDSPDERYKDGKNPVLSRFYNYDFQFGNWFNRMKEKGVFENTLLVFTTDHASYNSPEWVESFHSQQNSFIAPIPLFLYGAGLASGRIDALGRNSLDLAPTLLDILGLADCENWFLGNSLFCPSLNQYDYYSAIGSYYFCTKDKSVKHVDSASNRIISDIEKSYHISVNE